MEMKTASKSERLTQNDFTSGTGFGGSHSHPRSIDVNIEELILHGIPSAARYRIAEVVQRELQLLFSQQHLPPQWRSSIGIECLNGGEFALPCDASPSKMGEGIARALCSGLSAWAAETPNGGTR
jgi:hypothetical protein